MSNLRRRDFRKTSADLAFTSAVAGRSLAAGRVEFWRDGEKIFFFTDPHLLTSGYFAFRTVRSHLAIRHFKVSSLR